jgi:preprotein translocase subunit SecY
MTMSAPPPLATWLLRHLGKPNEALVGDLLEKYETKRSDAWYWRQVVFAIAVGRSVDALVIVGALGLLSLGRLVPAPGINSEALALLGRQSANNSFGLYDLMSGGNLSSVTIFALGIAPYVTAAVVGLASAFLWTRAFARRPLVSLRAWTWTLALVLAALQSLGMALFLERQSARGLTFVADPGWTFRLVLMAALTAGTGCLMLFSDLITERRLGNGLYLFFLSSIGMALFQSPIPRFFDELRAGWVSATQLAWIVARLLGTCAFVAVVSHFYARTAFEQKPAA